MIIEGFIVVEFKLRPTKGSRINANFSIVSRSNEARFLIVVYRALNVCQLLVNCPRETTSSMGKFGMTSKEFTAKVKAKLRKINRGKKTTVFDFTSLGHAEELKQECDELVLEEGPSFTTEEIIEYPAHDASIENMLQQIRESQSLSFTVYFRTIII